MISHFQRVSSMLKSNNQSLSKEENASNNAILKRRLLKLQVRKILEMNRSKNFGKAREKTSLSSDIDIVDLQGSADIDSNDFFNKNPKTTKSTKRNNNLRKETPLQKVAPMESQERQYNNNPPQMN